MANKNVTRVGNTHEKKSLNYMVVTVDADTRKEFDAAGNYLVGYLPERAVIQQAEVWTNTLSDAGVITVGTTEGGAEILSAGDSGAPGTTGTFAGKSNTGTGVPVFVTLAAPATTGDFNVVIEYVELTLSTGFLTVVD